MLTTLVIGDPHFKVSNVQDMRLMVNKTIEVAKKKKPSFIVCLGDILDRHETIHVIPLTESIGFLDELRKIAPLYVIIGNHDRPNNSNFLTKEHPFSALKAWNDTFVADSVLEKVINDKKFLFVPYVPPGRFMEALAIHFKIYEDYFLAQLDLKEYKKSLLEEDNSWSEEREKLYDNQQILLYQNLFNDYLKDICCIFAHQEFRDAKMGAIKSKEGDLWCLNWPYVISGHIHDYDQLTNNILYTGTPLPHAFGDRDDKTISWVFWKNDEKKVELSDENNINLDDGEKKVKFLDKDDEDVSSEISYFSISHKRIDLKLPKKKILYMNTDQVLRYFPKDEDNENHIKVVINGTAAEIKTVMKNSHINFLKSKNIKISYKEEVLKTVEEITQERQQQLNRLSYSQRLYRKIYKDSDMKRFYIEHYGHIDEKQLWKIAPKFKIIVKDKKKIIPESIKDE